MPRLSPAAPLTLKALEDHLWESANHFRSKVSNQKDYILALLFFKRASDIYAEETARALERLAGAPGAERLARDPAWHALQVPPGNDWDAVRGTDADRLGQALNDALGALGRANPRQLTGVFEHIDFNNRQALSNQDLADVVDHFHELGPLGNARVSSDLLGQAYEWLIAKFAAQAGKKGGDFYTPAEVGRVCAAIVEPRAGEHVYDPTCGSGGLLLQALARAEQTGQDVRSISLFGQEISPETWAIARMNMLLHGVGDAAQIEREDTIRTPAFLDAAGGVRRFDVVVANPPFSSKNWGQAWLKSGGDPFGRIRHVPPLGHGEMAFVQHMVASLDPRVGRMVVVLPNGALYRGGSELAVRRDLLAADLVEAVVSLSHDIFYGSKTTRVSLLVCRAAKPEKRRGRVRFVQADGCFARVGARNVLRDRDVARILDAYRADDEEEGFTAWATTQDVAARRYNLSARLYVGGLGEPANAAVGLAEAVDALRAAQAARAETDARLAALLATLPLDDDAEADPEDDDDAAG